MSKVIQIATTFNGGIIALMADGRLFERVGEYSPRGQNYAWKPIAPPDTEPSSAERSPATGGGPKTAAFAR